MVQLRSLGLVSDFDCAMLPGLMVIWVEVVTGCGGDLHYLLLMYLIKYSVVPLFFQFIT